MRTKIRIWYQIQGSSQDKNGRCPSILHISGTYLCIPACSADTNHYNFLSEEAFAAHFKNFSFSVRCCNSARILLTNEINNYPIFFFEFKIGHDNNKSTSYQWCLTRDTGKCCSYKSVSSSRILNCDRFRVFWISWDTDIFQLGIGDGTVIETAPITMPTMVNYVAVSTNSGLNDTWIFNEDK